MELQLKQQKVLESKQGTPSSKSLRQETIPTRRRSLSTDVKPPPKISEVHRHTSQLMSHILFPTSDNP